jgi:hypothetical protein
MTEDKPDQPAAANLIQRHVRDHRLGPHIAAAVSDVASCLGVPFANLVGKAMEALHEQRMEAAREILLGDLRRGTAKLSDPNHIVDEIVPVLHRYLRAAEEGAARNNLRLLSRIITGQIQGDTLVASEFLAWSDVLSGLRPHEIRVLAGIQQFVDASGDDWSWDNSNVTTAVLREKTAACAHCTADQIDSALASLTRTGLLVPASGWDSIVYRPSKLYAAFREFASFEGLEAE